MNFTFHPVGLKALAAQIDTGSRKIQQVSGTDPDNTVFAPNAVLGSKSGLPGDGRFATGLTGGVTGLYRIYFTTPVSTNVDPAGSSFTITQNGEPIVLPVVNLNSAGTAGANNAWKLLASVHLVEGTTYTVTQTSNADSFVSQRAHGVMWELVTAGPLFGVFKWEYVDPSDPSQGKQQSSTLAPDGYGVQLGPESGAYYRDLTKAYVYNTDISNARFDGVDFTNAYLRRSNFTNTEFNWTNFTSADLSQTTLDGAEFDPFTTMNGADFSGASVRRINWKTATARGLTAAQLYSTASYQAHDLSGINLEGNDLIGWNFAGQNLSGAHFSASKLTNVDFTGADVRGANFGRAAQFVYSPGTGLTLTQLASTATYASLDLAGIGLSANELSGAIFAGFNLTGADLSSTNLTNSDMSSADLTDTNLPAADLSGANLNHVNAPRANFQGATLTGANMSYANLEDANLSGVSAANADFRHANLRNAEFTSNLSNADLAGAEIRGADFHNYGYDPGISLSQLYSTASYQAHDLSGVGLAGNNLTGADFSYVNLTGANLSAATLFMADFTGANISGANLSRVDAATGSSGAGISLSQLYSTANYQARDLSGVDLSYYDLSGADFSGQNMRSANILFANVSGVDFSGAQIDGMGLGSVTSHGFVAAQLYETASYESRNLRGVRLTSNDLTGWDFTDQDLTQAIFNGSTVVGADFTGAIIQGAHFSNSDFSSEQLYSTASYQSRDLRGIGLYFRDVQGWNFAGQDLQFANFDGAVLTGAILIGADVRGATFERVFTPWVCGNGDCPLFHGTGLAGAIAANLIEPDGHVWDLQLVDGAELVVRNYPTANIPKIVVDQQLMMDATGTLRIVLDANAWHSTIAFAPNIPVTRGGTLELAFTDGTNVASQIGRTFDLFDWNGVDPTGMFTVATPYVWDLSNLYTTGEVTLTAIPDLPGDFNHDGTVDLADYVVWRKGLAAGNYTQGNYETWRANFGRSFFGIMSGEDTNPVVPEPSTMLQFGSGIVAILFMRRLSW